MASAPSLARPYFYPQKQSHHHRSLAFLDRSIQSLPFNSPSHRLRHCSLRTLCFVSSVKENIGRFKKNWNDFTSLNYWVVRDYNRLVNDVNALEPRIQRLSDDQLTAKTEEFKGRLRQGETLADIQAEAFAVVREAAKRKLGMRHFDVQIVGGAVLHDGCIAEMKTGEGKTLVSTLAAYLNALSGEGVHVVTVNDYLAQRDAEWMGGVHRFLGLSVGLIQRGMKADERRSNYACDITYTNNSELGFDYLRDNLAGDSGQLVMRWPRPFRFAIVDEVDSVLIDEGRNPLLISGEASKDAARFPVAAKVAELLVRGLVSPVLALLNDFLSRIIFILTNPCRTSSLSLVNFNLSACQFCYQHYSVELKDNSVELTEEGIALAETALETKDLWDENDPWARFVMNALKAKEFYRQDVQYIVRNGKALIINENSEYLSDLLTKRKIPHNVLNARPRYAAREAEIIAQAGRKYAITISTNMAGRGTDIILGGNPKMLAKEILEDSLLPFLTQEPPDIEVYGEPVSQQVLSKVTVGQSSLALLAKTALIEGKSWSYQDAKSIIAESMQLSQSLDVMELEKLVEEQSEMYPLGPTIALAYTYVLKDCEVHCFNEGSEVKRLGGLHVIGTSLHESRRIDNQLRGRAGRQGDPGSTRFMVSLQDEMFQKFNFDTEWAVKLISRITNDEDIPIEGGAIVKQLLALQVNAEKYFFGIRKSLVEFDEVLEVQRKHVYDLRQLILTGDDESCSHQVQRTWESLKPDD
ncbi:SecA, preprotein cross-linking domain [Dillenia turbinata]|uniref:chloroplast protein-transporting ATPase n=1 Tax=Dillenia turbinata TaxID=194707 RepID=A0AAN8VYD9_9MAGN